MNYQELQEAKETFRLQNVRKEFKALDKLRREFVMKFSPMRIQTMSIDDFVIGLGRKDTFCYMLERNLKGLGNITGQPSSKFGVWFSPKDNSYKYEGRLGKNYKEAFTNVKKYMLELLVAGLQEDYEAIITNPISALFKGKILSTYYPEKYLNIFSRAHLDYYLNALNLDTAKLLKSNVLYKRQALVNFKNSDKDMKDWSIYEFAYFLWAHYPKAPMGDGEAAVKSKEETIAFPSIDEDDIEFVNPKISFGASSSSHSSSSSATPSPDYEKESRKYKILGDRGEYIVMMAEKKRLIKELSISTTKADKLIRWVAKESDKYGYDILSVSKDMRKRYIEVKATQRKVGDMDFYYTENELETAKKYGKDYYIYVVYDIQSTNPKVWMIQNPFEDKNKVVMKPVKYKVHIVTQKD